MVIIPEILESLLIPPLALTPRATHSQRLSVFCTALTLFLATIFLFWVVAILSLLFFGSILAFLSLSLFSSESNHCET